MKFFYPPEINLDDNLSIYTICKTTKEIEIINNIEHKLSVPYQKDIRKLKQKYQKLLEKLL